MDTKQYFLTMAVVLLSCLFVGCSPGKTSVEERKQFAIQSIEKNWVKSKNKFEAQRGKDILSVLKTIDVKKINNPILASSVFISGKDNWYDLTVMWIEKYPSVDGFEFQYSAQVPPIIILIPPHQLKWNKESVTSTVVFGAEYIWYDEPEQWKIFDQISSAKDLKVRLLRAKIPVTEWYPVRFYKAGYWIE